MIYFDVDGVLWKEKFSVINEKWIEHYKGLPKENKHAIELCKKLIANGYKVGIISKKWTNPWMSDINLKIELAKKLNIETIILINQEDNKCDFHSSEEDVLIDDNYENLKFWNGISIGYDDGKNKPIVRQNSIPVINENTSYDDLVKIIEQKTSYNECLKYQKEMEKYYNEI